MNIHIFRVENNRIKLNKYKLVVRLYDDLSKKSYRDNELYLSDSELTEWETQLIPKHQLYELISKEVIDSSLYEWMNDIELKTSDRGKEIAEIAAYGSKEAYEASLPEFTDNYILDLENRVSLMELGLN